MLAGLLQCGCGEKVVITLLVLVYAVRTYLKYKYGVCKSSRRLDGKTAIVTGANTGIGFETAKDFAQRRARVILACRDVNKANKARDDIVMFTGNRNVIVKRLDLASLRSVREFAKEINASEDRLDILVNNAGAIWLGNKKTEDGLDLGMHTNHFGPFLLTNLLVDLMKKTGPGRIVFVSSSAHSYPFIKVDDINFEKHFSNIEVYSYSKLGNVVTANELARRLAGTGITVNSLHPGAVKTEALRVLPQVLVNFFHIGFSFLLKTCEEGAQTTIHLAVSEEVQGITGKYFQDCKEASMSTLAKDEEFAKKLWKQSEKLTSE